MKKFLLQILLLAFTINVFASPISQTEAMKVAKVYLASTSSTFSISTSQMDLVSISTLNLSIGAPQFFIFNSTGNFIIISGDDAAIPVIAYSNEGALQLDNLPPGFIKWMDKVKLEINYIRSNKLEATEEINSEWSDLYNNRFKNSATNSVNPLISTKWDQSPNYNALCPYDYTNSDRTVTGCVATAMAQILKYHNYPAQGTGSHSYNHSRYGTLSANFGATTYNWTSMPNSISSANSAIALLMYHCGVSVDMNYNIGTQGGSGAVSSLLPNAYKNYFGYSSSVSFLYRTNYSDASWLNLLKLELDASRPIQYAGSGTNGGHSFVMDGYDNTDKFHFNWGWSGNSDGYFTINALNPGSLGTGGGAGGFNSNQRACTGIKPPAGGSTSYDMRLYSSIVVNPNPIKYNSGFSATVNFANYGLNAASNFVGDFCTAIFNSSNQFVSYIEIKTGYTLNFNNHYINPLVFSTTSIAALTPGTYTIGAYYKPTGAAQWTTFSNGSYQNFISVVVDGNTTNPLKLYAAITTNPVIITQNQTFTVNFDIANFSTGSFTGDVSVDIHKSDGTWIRELSIKNGLSLPTNTHFASGLTYTITGGINDVPGTYQLFIWDKPSAGNWEFVGNGSFKNPIIIQVVAPGLIPDGYEVNNTLPQAAKLNMNFSGSNGSIKTSLANFHIGSDIDYYYIDLAPNFKYTLTPRIHDSYSSGDGNTYTCDATFAYSWDGINFSESIDDIMTGNVLMNNGGRMYFIVSPYFTGNTGTYSLEVLASRIANSGINSSGENQLSCYPNPANDIITIELSKLAKSHIQIIDVSGKVVKELDKESSSIKLDIKELEQGIYFLTLTDGTNSYYSKFVVTR